RQVGDRIDHQPLDEHLNQHRSPRRLFGAAAVMRTGTRRPTHSLGPGKLTTVFPLVRPDNSHARRFEIESTRTSVVVPIAASCNCCWIDRWRFCKVRIRAVLSASVTSSARRLRASVFGRGEYLNEYIE